MNFRRSASALVLSLLSGLFVCPWITPGAVAAPDYEQEPIRYSTSPVDDAVARLEARLARGEIRLRADSGTAGYLAAVLEALAVPMSSQVLVFSKTSLQRNHISPGNPRAIYFNDEIYVGWVPGGEVLEIAAVDPRQGTIFYVLRQPPAGPARFQRARDCVQCHDSNRMTGGVPGLVMRSVFPDRTGQPILTAGTFVTDQQSPLSERWGGWYVTGKHGRVRHMGNVTARGTDDAATLDREAGANVTDLRDRFAHGEYPGGAHSDLVALLVLEHQTQMHNLITRASFETRLALSHEAAINQALGRPIGERLDSTGTRIKGVGEPLLQHLLFSGAPRWPEPMSGTSSFAKEFASRGRCDPLGRSLRDLDLKTRLLRYPCSPLVYGKAFDELPAPVKDYVFRRLWEVLTDKDRSAGFQHLSPADRRAIREILLATKAGLPHYWGAEEEARGTK